MHSRLLLLMHIICLVKWRTGHMFAVGDKTRPHLRGRTPEASTPMVQVDSQLLLVEVSQSRGPSVRELGWRFGYHGTAVSACWLLDCFCFLLFFRKISKPRLLPAASLLFVLLNSLMEQRDDGDVISGVEIGLPDVVRCPAAAKIFKGFDPFKTIKKRRWNNSKSYADPIFHSQNTPCVGDTKEIWTV